MLHEMLSIQQELFLQLQIFIVKGKLPISMKDASKPSGNSDANFSLRVYCKNLPQVADDKTDFFVM